MHHTFLHMTCILDDQWRDFSIYRHAHTHAHIHTHAHMHGCGAQDSQRVLFFCRNWNSLHIIMSYVLWPEICISYILYIYTILSPSCMVRCPGVTDSLVLLHKNVKCPSLFKLPMLFASENKYLQLQLATFLQKACCTQYYFVWTDVIPVTLHWSEVAWLCSSPQLTWAHGLFQ